MTFIRDTIQRIQRNASRCSRRPALVAKSRSDLATIGRALSNIKKPKMDEINQGFCQIAIEKASKLKALIKHTKALNDDYPSWTDEQKIAHYTKDPDVDQFYKRFPIIARYMVCLEMYSKKAFTRFLKLMATPSPADEIQDRMLRLQAKYIQFLWEECEHHKGRHPGAAESNKIYEDTFAMLKKEDDDFKKRYDEIKDELEKRNNLNNAEKLKELIDRLSKNPDDTMVSLLLEKLQKLKDSEVKKIE